MDGTQNAWNDAFFSREILQQVRITPIIAYQGKVSEQWRKAAYARPFYTWWWFEKGIATITTHNARYNLEAGQWIFLPCNIWRRQHFHPSAEIISISFAVTWQGNHPLIHTTAPLTGSQEIVPSLVETARRVIATFRPLNDGTIPTLAALPLSRSFALTAALYEFASLLFQYAIGQGAEINAFPFGDARLAWVIQDLQQHLQAGPLPYARWTEKTRLSRSQLERLAQKYLRKTLRAYRDDLLVTAASRALASDLLRVKQVAEQFGFVDTSHFCRWLKAHTGTTPASFQQGNMA